MKFGFKFSNLCGTVYKKGNILFTKDGNSLISPVGNRVSVFDLINNTSVTLPFENRKDISILALSPDSNLLLSIDEEGHTLLINFVRRVVLAYFNFRSKVLSLQFSTDGKWFAAGTDKGIEVWKTPGLHKEFSPFVFYRNFPGHHDSVISIDWSQDSKFFLSASKDLSIRIHSMFKQRNFISSVLSGHRNPIIAAFFDSNNTTIYSIGKDGAVFVWISSPIAKETGKKLDQIIGEEEEEEEEEEEKDKGLSENKLVGVKWTLQTKHFCNQSKVVCCAFHKEKSLLVIGFDNGIFGLYDLPEFNNIHILSISQHKINTVAINSSGEWLAFGSSQLGQLLVWEWQSETYVLRQQGHSLDMNTLAYSPDGQNIATGGDDGRVKIWNVNSGFCFVTFKDHTAPITAITFGYSGNAVFSASLDGTVRAYDLTRYRNFRTMIANTPCQFFSLVVAPSEEIICAGSQDKFEIFVWSLRTGKLLDILSGHEGPISGLAFNPIQNFLASISWDGTLRWWDIFESKPAQEALKTGSEVLALAYRPDGKEICVATLDGNIQFWDPENGIMTGFIEGKKDIMGGRKSFDVRTAKTDTSKHFTSICYSADGRGILAGSNGKYVCIYDVPNRVLLKKFQVSRNQSLDGTLDFLNSKRMTNAGPLDLIDEDVSDEEEKFRETLPGVQRDLTKRNVKKAVRTKCVMFSPNGRSWAAATTEGLLIYSLDDSYIFDPFDLDIDITPQTIFQTLKEKEYLKSLIMALRLNEQDIIFKVVETIPFSHIQLLLQHFPINYLKRLLEFLGKRMENSPHIEFYLLWFVHAMNIHGQFMKDNSSTFMPVFRQLQKNFTKQYSTLSSICDDNTYTLDYLSTLYSQKKLEEGGSKH